MKNLKPRFSLLAIVLAGTLAGCTSAVTKTADVAGVVRTSLDQAGLKDVSVTQDREKGVVTLGGHVPAIIDKERAEAVTRPLAGSQVVANEIAVIPIGVEADAKKINSALDDGIQSNLNAALIQQKLDDRVKFSVKNHVVTLTGEVDSQDTRARAEKVAASILNVQQVVNTLQVKVQKATSTN